MDNLAKKGKLMNNRKKLFVVLFCLAIWGLPVIGIAEEKADTPKTAGKIKWYNYEQGLARSEAEKKMIFLTFYADWCAYCKVMDKKTFSDNSIISSLNNNFVPIIVNSDKERKIAKAFRVRGLPDSWFISNTGKIIGHRPGYIPPEQFIKILDNMLIENGKLSAAGN